MKYSLDKITGSFQQWLIDSLKSRDEMIEYLKVAVEEFEKDGNEKVLVQSMLNCIAAMLNKGLEFEVELNINDDCKENPYD